MFHMKNLRLFTLLLTVAASNLYAQTNYGGEIVSCNTFGEGQQCLVASPARGIQRHKPDCHSQ